MATLLIFDGAMAGALAGILDGRQYNGTNPATPPTAQLALSAKAFAQQFLTANAALATPMVDATTNIALVCYAAAYGELSGRNYTSAVSTDYALQATAAVAMAKAVEPNLT